MRRRITILPDASAEFNESVDWYEKKSRGRGELFAAAVVDVMERCLQDPGFYPIVRRSTRQARVLNYPFCVYFQEVESGILVISIFHTKRNPKIWQQRDP
jgi:hypothetical protein